MLASNLTKCWTNGSVCIAMLCNVQQTRSACYKTWLAGWLVVFRIYVALAVFQPYRDLEAGDNQSLKFKWRGRESNPGPLAPQAKRLTTWPPPFSYKTWREMCFENLYLKN